MTSVNMSPEQLKDIVSAAVTTALQVKKEMDIQPRPEMKLGSLAQCPERYGGPNNDIEAESFLGNISTYKIVEKIPDEDALNGLSIVLQGDPQTWWFGIKKEVKSWKEFEKRFRDTFAPKKMNYQVLQDIIEKKQDKQTNTEIFVARKRALIAQIETDIAVNLQIDMVYGQLRFQIREKIPRDSIKSFDELLSRAKEIERNIAEKEKHFHSEQEKSEKPKKKIRCNYCKLIGHTIDVCRKRLAADRGKTEPAKMKDNPPIHLDVPNLRTKLVCYGCGEPGFVRSRCPKCNINKDSSVNISFCSIDTNIDIRRRSVLPINVDGYEEMAYVDTCAKTSVASFNMYTYLKEKGYTFKEEIMLVTLADGITKRQIVLTVKVPVSLYNRTILTSFIVLPQAKNNKTLLGVGFIEDANLELNLPQLTCIYLDEPTKIFDLKREQNVICEEDTILSPFEFSGKLGDRYVNPSAPQTAYVANYKRLGGLRPTTLSDPMEGCVPGNIKEPSTKRPFYSLVPPPSKRKCSDETLFDGYSPVLDALYEDAKRTFANYSIQLSPESAKLFPDTDIAAIDLMIEQQCQLQSL